MRLPGRAIIVHGESICKGLYTNFRLSEHEFSLKTAKVVHGESIYEGLYTNFRLVHAARANTLKHFDIIIIIMWYFGQKESNSGNDPNATRRNATQKVVPSRAIKAIAKGVL